MPEKLTSQEFARKLKQKYPEYKDVDDTELVSRVLKKYPQYQETVQETGPSPSFVDPLQIGPTILRNITTPLKGIGAAIGEEERLRQEAFRKSPAKAVLRGLVPLPLSLQKAFTERPLETAAEVTGIPSAARLIKQPLEQVQKGEALSDILGVTPLGAFFKKVSPLKAGILTEPAKAAERLGMKGKLPASAQVSPESLGIRSMERTLAGVSEKVGKRAIQAGMELKRVTGEFKDKIMQGFRREKFGEVMTRDLRKFTKDFFEQSDVLYEALPSNVREGTFIAPIKTSKLIDDLTDVEVAAREIADPSTAKALKPLEDVLSQPISVDKARAFIRKLREGVPGLSEDVSRKISLFLKEDLDLDLKFKAQRNPEIAQFVESLDQANRFYKEGNRVLETTMAKNINRLAKSSEFKKIGRSIINAEASPAQIKDLFKVASKESREMLKAEALRQIFEKSMAQNGVIKPVALKAQLTLWEDKLNVLFDKKTLQTLKDVDTVASAMSSVSFSLPKTPMQRLIEGAPLRAGATLISRAPFIKQFLGSSLAQKYLLGQLVPRKTLHTVGKAMVPATPVGVFENIRRAAEQKNE